MRPNVANAALAIQSAVILWLLLRPPYCRPDRLASPVGGNPVPATAGGVSEGVANAALLRPGRGGERAGAKREEQEDPLFDEKRQNVAGRGDNTVPQPRPSIALQQLQRAGFGRRMSGPQGSFSPAPCPAIQGYTGYHPVHDLVSKKNSKHFPGAVLSQRVQSTPQIPIDRSQPVLLPSYVEHVRSLGPITKAAHVSWKTDSIFTSKSGGAVHGVQAIGRLNPDWQVGPCKACTHKSLAPRTHAPLPSFSPPERTRQLARSFNHPLAPLLVHAADLMCGTCDM